MANIANSISAAALTKLVIDYQVPNTPPVLPRLVLPSGQHKVVIPAYGKSHAGIGGIEKRELGADYPRRWSENPTTTTVVLERYSGKEVIDEDDPALVGNSVGAVLETAADRAKLLKSAMTQYQTYKEATALTTTGNYGATATPTTKWDASGADPFGDIETGMATVADAIGWRPDTLVIPQRVVDKLKTTSAFLDRAKYTQAPMAQGGDAVLNALKAIVGVRQVIVPPFVQYIDAGGNLTDVWSDDVALLYLGAGANIRTAVHLPIYGLMLEEAGFPKVRVKPVEIGTGIFLDHWFKEHIATTDAGYLLTNTLT